MALTPNTDWKTDDKYPAARIIELEAAAATGEAAAATATAANEAASAAAQSIDNLRKDVATKKYVDDLLAAQAATITALTARVAALEAPKG